MFSILLQHISKLSRCFSSTCRKCPRVSTVLSYAPNM
jgi:hypothetical protein